MLFRSPQGKTKPPAGLKPGELTPDSAQLRQEIRKKINSLQTRANGGVWVLAAFLLLSILAFRNFDLFPSLSVEARRILGPSPPVRLIQVALLVYGFSGTVLILARMARGTQPGNSWLQLGYLAAFFGFFHFAGALGENFWAVLTAGVMVMGLQAFQVWSHWGEQAREEQDRLARLEGANRPPQSGQ